MDTIQTDVSNASLVTALRANLCDFFRHTSRSNPAEHFENERFVRWYTPFPHPWFNGVLAAQLPKNGVRSFITETVEYFHEKAVNTFTWWMEPPLRSSDWESVLSKHNFGISKDTPGLAIDLDEMNGFIPQVDGLEISPVESEQSLRNWVKVFTKGYGLFPDWEPVVFDLGKKMGLEFPLRHYLGYLNGEPVSTSSLFVSGGVVGVYCVSTLPHVRGRGLGSALTVQPLRDAREMGYRIGVLHSPGIGQNMIKRLGGKHVCQIENYYLTIL